MGKFITQYWYAYKSPRKLEYAHSAYQKKFCENCKKANRNRIMKTHNTVDCRFKVDKQIDHDKKSEVSNSTALFHDTGASKSMVNFKLDEELSTGISIPIETAGKNQEPQIGTATGPSNIGKLPVEAIHVPTNWISETQ